MSCNEREQNKYIVATEDITGGCYDEAIKGEQIERF